MRAYLAGLLIIVAVMSYAPTTTSATSSPGCRPTVTRMSPPSDFYDFMLDEPYEGHAGADNSAALRSR